MNYKFWAINFVAFFIVFSYIITSLFDHSVNNSFWTASPFQLVFMIAFFYLVGEGKLIQKIILAKKIREDETMEEFKVINKVSNSFDQMVLDKLKK